MTNARCDVTRRLNPDVSSSVRIFLLAILLIVDPVNSRRVKRIVGGWEIRARDPSFMPYNSVRYFAWIENGHSCDRSPSWWDRWPKWLISAWCAPRNDTLKCGGALITPQIVQTACHCAADFMVVGKGEAWRPAVARNAWSVGYSVYLGLSHIEEFAFKLQVWSMWVHPKCAVLNFSPRYITHDFGWMYLDFKIQDHFIYVQDYFMDYAPLYKMETLERLSKETFAKELVCLIIGFGKVKETDVVGSKVMKHAWMQVLPPDMCYWITVLWKRGLEDYFDLDAYKKYNSWVCGTPYNKFFNGSNAGGDSGSPVTCDNNYFALVSSHQHPKKIKAGLRLILRQHAIKYAPKENAAEYRAAFIELLDTRDWKNSIDDELRALRQRGRNQFFSVQHLPKVNNDTSPRVRSQSSQLSATPSSYRSEVLVNPALGLLFILLTFFPNIRCS